MTTAGSHGWFSDKAAGYRYQPCHPQTARPWPQIPHGILAIWRAVHPGAPPPQCCLINYYEDPRARMGLHVDADEADFSVPILSLSLGDTALFRIGGLTRKAPTRSVRLASGDVVSLAQDARRAFRGIDRVYPGTMPVARRTRLSGRWAAQYYPPQGDGWRVTRSCSFGCSQPAGSNPQECDHLNLVISGQAA